MTSSAPAPEDWPAWAVEGVRLSPYDPRWPDRAARYAAGLRPVLDPWLLGPVEHAGSTSVPGLTAKPVIDLMARVSDPDEVVRRTGPVLGERGWRYVPPELDGRPWRRCFVLVSANEQHRLAHLHLMAAGARRWDEQLRFRDTLRSRPELRREYAEVKSGLALTYGGDRERYTEEKGAFVTRVLNELAREAR